MNKTEQKEEVKEAKCTMCVISEGKGLCRHPEPLMAFLRIVKDLPASEIECNGTPMEIEHCPMFYKSSAPADFMAQIDQHNKFQESFVGAAMSILKAQGMSEEQIEKVKQQVGMEEKRQEESINKLWDIGKTIWKDYVEPAANKAREREENNIKIQQDIISAAIPILKAHGLSVEQLETVKQQVKRQEESQIAFSLAIPFMKATGLSNKRIEIIKSLMKLEGDIDKELDPDDQKDLCGLYNMMLCEDVDQAACMESILRIGLGKNYSQENIDIDKMCGVSKLIWKDYIESIEKKTEEKKKIDALKKDNDDLSRQIAAEKKRIAELKTPG